MSAGPVNNTELQNLYGVCLQELIQSIEVHARWARGNCDDRPNHMANHDSSAIALALAQAYNLMVQKRPLGPQ